MISHDDTQVIYITSWVFGWNKGVFSENQPTSWTFSLTKAKTVAAGGFSVVPQWGRVLFEFAFRFIDYSGLGGINNLGGQTADTKSENDSYKMSSKYFFFAKNQTLPSTR